MDQVSTLIFNPPQAPQRASVEDAAHAVYWQLWESIRKVSQDRLVDNDEVLNAVWRKATLDSLRARRKPEELFNDLLHILTEWKRANG